MPIDGRVILEGVVIPIVTPMDAQRRPDPAGAEPLLDALAAASVRRIMLFGSNGEGPALRTDQLGPFAEHVARAWRERVPDGIVILNTSGTATADALLRAEQLLPAKPDVLLLGPPSFFRHGRPELVEHYKAFADVGAPVVIYNSPVYSGNDIGVDVVRDLLDLDFVVGIKDSSRGEGRIADLVSAAADRGDFGVSQGDERAMVQAFRDGANGITPGIGNLAPAVVIALHAAARTGDWNAAEAGQALANELIGIHGIRPGIPAIKAALTERGLCTPYASLPFIPYSAEEVAAMAAFLAPFDANLAGVAR
jgi:4-hydroxy-tetrahydrodipicolinate synthase